MSSLLLGFGATEHDSRCLQAKSMAMASSAPAESAASSPTVAREPGRPSKVLVGEGEPLVVTVEGKQDVLLTTRDDLKQCNEVLSPFMSQTDCSMSGIGRCSIGWTICHY